jgi:hypothetical protein
MEHPMIETRPTISFRAGEQEFCYSIEELKIAAAKLFKDTSNAHAILVLSLFDKDSKLSVKHAIAIFIALESGDLELDKNGQLPPLTYT